MGEGGQYGTAQDREFQVGVDQNTKKVMQSFTMKKSKRTKINTHKFLLTKCRVIQEWKNPLSQKEEKIIFRTSNSRGKWPRRLKHKPGVNLVLQLADFVTFPFQLKNTCQLIINNRSKRRNSKTKKQTNTHTLISTQDKSPMEMCYNTLKKKIPFLAWPGDTEKGV